jgi:hypothetical protein
VDGISVEVFGLTLEEELTRLQRALRDHTYRAQPLLRVTVDKPQGGGRALAIPTIAPEAAKEDRERNRAKDRDDGTGSRSGVAEGWQGCSRLSGKHGGTGGACFDTACPELVEGLGTNGYRTVFNKP